MCSQTGFDVAPWRAGCGRSQSVPGLDLPERGQAPGRPVVLVVGSALAGGRGGTKRGGRRRRGARRSPQPHRSVHLHTQIRIPLSSSNTRTHMLLWEMGRENTLVQSDLRIKPCKCANKGVGLLHAGPKHTKSVIS
jgi:hypothetical protein